MATDRRIKYTINILNESLLKLLNEKPLARITVTEICKLAEVNRGTYYNHFEDPYDQFKQLEDSFFGKIKADLKKIAENTSDDELLKILIKICTYYYQNKETFLILSKHGKLSERYVETFENSTNNNFRARKFEYEGIREYDAVYIISGVYMVIYKWLSKDSEKYTPTQIAEYISKICNNGLH